MKEPSIMEPVRAPLENEEYHAALFTVRRAKNCLWWLIVLSLVVQMAAFVSVRYAGVIDDAPQLSGVASSDDKQATTAPAKVLNEETSGAAWIWYDVLCWILPATKYIAMAAGMLLVLTMLTAVQLSLVGRTGGVAGFIGGFFWSLLLLVFLIPWQQVTGSTLACGALYNLGELIDWTRPIIWDAKDATLLTKVLYYDRFIGYPVFILLLSLVVQMKFIRGWRRASLSIMQADLREPADQNDNL
jgi:hypothetical protein